MSIRRDADRLREYIDGLTRRHDYDTYNSCKVGENHSLDSNVTTSELSNFKYRIQMKLLEEKIRQEEDYHDGLLLASNLVQMMQIHKQDHATCALRNDVIGQHDRSGFSTDRMTHNDHDGERIIAQHELEHEMSLTEHVNVAEEIHEDDTPFNNVPFRSNDPTDNNHVGNVDGRDPLHTHSIESEECFERFTNFWHEMELMAMAAAYGTFKVQSQELVTKQQHDEKRDPLQISWPILHALSAIGCPSEIAWLAIKLYPDQLYKRDKNGNLPIHIASKSHSTALSEGVWWHKDAERDGQTPTKMRSGTSPMLECLLRVYPEGCLIMNSEGQLPIHLALRAGKMWETGIYDIFRACPSVLIGAMRDTPSQLHSFMLAAATRRSCDTGSGEIYVLGQHDTNANGRQNNEGKWEEIYARRNASHSIGSMWRYLPISSKRQHLLNAKVSLERKRLTTIYELLKSMPHHAVSTGNSF